MSDTVSGHLKLDGEAYGELASVFLERFLVAMLSELLEEGKIAKGETLSEADVIFVYKIAFRLLSQFEEFHGVELGEQRYPTVLAFAQFPDASPLDPPLTASEFIVSDARTELHGGVDDSMIQAAYRKARAGL